MITYTLAIPKEILPPYRTKEKEEKNLFEVHIFSDGAVVYTFNLVAELWREPERCQFWISTEWEEGMYAWTARRLDLVEKEALALVKRIAESLPNTLPASKISPEVDLSWLKQAWQKTIRQFTRSANRDWEEMKAGQTYRFRKQGKDKDRFDATVVATGDAQYRFIPVWIEKIHHQGSFPYKVGEVVEAEWGEVFYAE